MPCPGCAKALCGFQEEILGRVCVPVLGSQKISMRFAVEHFLPLDPVEVEYLMAPCKTTVSNQNITCTMDPGEALIASRMQQQGIPPLLLKGEAWWLLQL